MLQTSIRDELLTLMNGLSLEEQQRVLEFTRSLSSDLPKGMSGTEFKRFAGLISPEDAAEMLKAIEEDCETIDPSQW